MGSEARRWSRRGGGSGRPPGGRGRGYRARSAGWGGGGGGGGGSAAGLGEDGVEHIEHEALLGAGEAAELLELVLELRGGAALAGCPGQKLHPRRRGDRGTVFSRPP